MARIRSIKPEFFTDEDLGELEPLDRLFFAGLWCHADRAGRLKEKIRELSVQILPYDKYDANAGLGRLVKGGFLLRYEVDGETYLQIRTWDRHQKPHHTERASTIPEPKDGDLTVKERLLNGDVQDARDPRPMTHDQRPKTKAANQDQKVYTMPQVLDTPECRAALAEWLEHKAGIGKPYKSSVSVEKLLAKWARAGPSRFVAAVEHSIGSNYQGLYEGGSNGQQAGNREEQRLRKSFDAINRWVDRAEGVRSSDGSPLCIEADGRADGTAT